MFFVIFKPRVSQIKNPKWREAMLFPVVKVFGISAGCVRKKESWKPSRQVPAAQNVVLQLWWKWKGRVILWWTTMLVKVTEGVMVD
jgi:hypothetical protein